MAKPQLSFYKHYPNLELFEQQSMLKTTIKLDDAKQPFFLKDIKLTGKGTGFFRIWLQASNGRKFLVLNSNAFKKNVPLSGVYMREPNIHKPFTPRITGFAAKDNDKGNKNGKGNDNENKGNDDNKGKNDNQGHDNKDKNNDDTNPPVSKTRTESRAKLERKLELIYGPSWLTPAQKQAMKRATEPEKLFETVTFNDVCIGTCSLSDGIMDTKYDLLIELDGYLEIKEIKYAVENI